MNSKDVWTIQKPYKKDVRNLQTSRMLVINERLIKDVQTLQTPSNKDVWTLWTPCNKDVHILQTIRFL